MGEIVQHPAGFWNMQHASPIHLFSHVAQRTFALPKMTSPTSGMFTNSSIQYMTSIFDRRNAVTEAAQAAGISKFHFIRRFKRETGMTSGEFLLRYRIVRAMDLLAVTVNPVAAVGRAVGYRNASAFSRAFQKVAGSSPCVYRRVQRDKPLPCAAGSHNAELRVVETAEPYTSPPPAAT
jgi:transcriptional regulator GlxA family with amidase domain